jgi:hypothetical protein
MERAATAQFLIGVGKDDPTLQIVVESCAKVELRMPTR